MDTATRIFELVDRQFKEQKEFAAAIGVSDKIVSQWRVGTTRSYRSRIAIIAEVLGTSAEYLLTGTGPKEKTSSSVSESDTIIENDLKAAFFEGGEDLTPEEMDELWEDAREYIQYKITQRRKKRDE
ncbi:hypothetical protein H8Z78_04340 [Dysosmobacter sp. NSJ-60]|nr:hypothetical protein [Dysosmobacter hominis]